MNYITPFKDPDEDTIRILCSCHDLEHYVAITREFEEIEGADSNFVSYTIGVQHNQHNFWIRLKMAIKLILKKRIYSDVCIYNCQLASLTEMFQDWLKEDKDNNVAEDE